MGGCCSKEGGGEGPKRKEHAEDGEEGELFLCCNGEGEQEGGTRAGEGGARVRLNGPSSFSSMYSLQGWKGVNQDALTIWEDFGGEKGTVFCGVFDGHGPLGHKVAGFVRDTLPSKLSSGLNSLHSLEAYYDQGADKNGESVVADGCTDPRQRWFSSWKATFLNAFEELDTQLRQHSTINCICSGTTAVSMIKQREQMIIGNLGDSRAILATRDQKDQLVPIQLTVDLKPDVPSEFERIRSCKGRVFALEEEPDVHRLWLPDEDCPGLAMARAFGDFCLKDYGLISTPQVCYRKLTEKDEFVVLATDGVWDVLSNKEVVKIVSSATKRSEAAKQLVYRAVRAWRSKHPTSKVDDCAAICLFLKHPFVSAKPSFDSRGHGTAAASFSADSFKTARSEEGSDSEQVAVPGSKQEWTALEGVSRVNSLLKVPRFSNVLSWRKRSVKAQGEED